MAASRRHLPIVLLFGVITAALVICCTPEASWANLNKDLYDFLYSSTYLNVAHAPGLPLYVMLGYIVSLIPGNDAWNLAFFLSVIPTLITCGLIFYIVAAKTSYRLAPYLATIAFAGSVVVFSQSIIPEIYALESMLLVGTYVLLTRGSYRTGLICLGLAMCISYGAVILLPIFLWRFFPTWKMRLKRLLWCLPPLLLYLYIPLMNAPPYMSLGPTSLESLMQYYLWHPTALLNLAIWEVPERLGVGIALIIASLGITTFIAARGIIKRENLTILLLALPGVIFFLTTSGVDALVQLTPSIAFLSIAAGYSVGDFKWARKLAVPAIACSLILLMVNTQMFDIGRTLDPSPTTATQFYQSLDKIPENNTMIVAIDAVTFAQVYYYNKMENRELKVIHPIYNDPDNALSWELERAGDVVMPEQEIFDPSIGEWPSNLDLWSLRTAKAFSDANPQLDVYLTISGPNRQIRSPRLVSTNIEPNMLYDSPLVEQHTSWWEYALVYPFAYKCTSGYYEMSKGWLISTYTNMTVGLLGVILAFGAVFGYYAPKKLFYKMSPKKKQFATMLTTAILAMMFCYFLGIMGVPGFRLW